MRISATIKKLRFNTPAYKNDVLAAGFDIMLRAASRFLEEAAPKVPIQTGMARGSFLNLMHMLEAHGYGHKVKIPEEPPAAFVGRLYYPIKVGRVKGTKAKYIKKSLAAIPKTPASAMELSTRDPKIIQRARGADSDRWNFAYETRVNHFNHNEVFSYGNGRPPWQAFTAGRAALEEYLMNPENIKSQLPSVASYIQVTNLSSGRDNIWRDFTIPKSRTVRLP